MEGALRLVAGGGSLAGTGFRFNRNCPTVGYDLRAVASCSNADRKRLYAPGPVLKLVAEFEESVKRHPLIAMGTPDPYVPRP